jgi:hypothetical protein
MALGVRARPAIANWIKVYLVHLSAGFGAKSRERMVAKEGGKVVKLDKRASFV